MIDHVTKVDANAQVDGKYLFAGFSEKTKPFTPTDPTLPISSTNPVIYNGDNGNYKVVATLKAPCPLMLASIRISFGTRQTRLGHVIGRLR